MHACTYTHTHTHTHTHTDFGYKRNCFQWPRPLLGDFPEAFHELSKLCVPKCLLLNLLSTTHHSRSALLFRASTRLRSPRAGTVLSQAQLSPARLLCPWDSPRKNTRVGSHFLLQEILPTQELKSGFLYCRQILLYAGILIFL